MKTVHDGGAEARVQIVATEFLRVRPVLVAPFLLFVVVVLAVSGAPTPQVIGLAVAGTSFLAFFSWERRRGTRRIVEPEALLRSLVATMAGIAIASTVTGAMASPLVPMLFAPVGVGFAAFGRRRGSGILLVGLVAIVAVLLAVSAAGWTAGLAVREGPRRVLFAAAIIDAVLLLRAGVATLAAAHERAAETLATTGDELVRAAQHRARSLESLGSRVAHEVKNPLAAIRAIVEVMLETAAADERATKRLTVAAGEIARIGVILDGYASEAHPLDSIRRRSTDIAELTGGLVALLEARARAAGVALALVEAPGATFDLDRDRVKEALLNVVLNAIDATPPGGEVRIAWTLSDEALEIVVEDTGRGMDAITLAKIGTPFFTGKATGTGLGVALARRVAKEHEGALAYESVVGRGTKATFRFPVKDADARRSDL